MRMPYSVSMPSTFLIAMRGRYLPRRRTGTPGVLQVLAGCNSLDRPAASGFLVIVLLDERAHVDDALALLAGDLRPVVRVGGVRQVFVLLELLSDRPQQIVDADA